MSHLTTPKLKDAAHGSDETTQQGNLEELPLATAPPCKHSGELRRSLITLNSCSSEMLLVQQIEHGLQRYRPRWHGKDPTDYFINNKDELLATYNCCNLISARDLNQYLIQGTRSARAEKNVFFPMLSSRSSLNPVIRFHRHGGL